MSAIIRNIVNQAYQLSGIISIDEEADGTDSAMAVIKLNELLAQLNVEQLFPYSRKIINYTITGAKPFYTIGTDLVLTADIAEERPCFINRMTYRYTSQSIPMCVQQIDLPDLLERQRSLGATGTPIYFATNPTYPLTEIYFDIIPTTGSILQIIYNAPIPQITINSTLAVPPEYNDVMVTGLARKLAVLKQMPVESITNIDLLWKEAISRVKDNNSRNQGPILDIQGGYGLGNNIFNFNAIGYN